MVTNEQVTQYHQDCQLLINLAKHPFLPTQLVVTIHHWLHKMAALTKASCHLQGAVKNKTLQTTLAELPLLNTESALALACQVAERLQQFTYTVKFTQIDFAKSRRIFQVQHIGWLAQLVNKLIAVTKSTRQKQPLSTQQTDQRLVSIITLINSSLSILEITDQSTLSTEIINLISRWKQLKHTVSSDPVQLMHLAQSLQIACHSTLAQQPEDNNTRLFPSLKTNGTEDIDAQTLTNTYVVEQSILKQLQQLMPDILDILLGSNDKQQSKHPITQIEQRLNVPCSDRTSLYYLLAQIHCQLSLWALHYPQATQLKRVKSFQQKLVQWQKRLEPTYGMTTENQDTLLSSSVWWQKSCEQISTMVDPLAEEQNKLIELATQLIAKQDAQQALKQLKSILLPEADYQSLKAIFTQAQQHQAKQFDTPQLNNLINKITTQQHQLIQLQQQQQALMLTHDAGLVLLWPFLSNLFNRAELTNTAGDEFNNETCQLTARSLLSYMRGEVNNLAGEYLADDTEEVGNTEVIANVLVGLAPETIVSPGIILDEKTKQLADECLTATIQHWQALKDMPIAGFQQLFLQRQATVAISEVGWRIEVKKHAVDILLSKLPWPLGVISLPWLEQRTALFIDWDN